MKLDLAVISVVLSTITCVTCTDSTSSDIAETGNGGATSLIDLLKLVDQTVNLQRFYDDDSKHTELEHLGDSTMASIQALNILQRALNHLGKNIPKSFAKGNAPNQRPTCKYSKLYIILK